MTIRNVVLGRLRPDLTDDERDGVRRALEGIRGLDLPGQLATGVGTDLALRDGGWDFAITNDWADADSYRGYDLDEEHNGHRAVIAGACAQLARVQFEL